MRKPRIETTVVILILWCAVACNYMRQEQQKQDAVADKVAVIKNLEQELAEFKNIKMTVTAYTASTSECDSTPNQTAIMEKPITNWTVAVSRDRAYMLGRTVWVEGLGLQYVNDLMNERYENRMDIVVANKAKAREWGVKERRVVLL